MSESTTSEKKSSLSTVAVGRHGAILQTMDDMWSMAVAIAGSGLAPSSYNTNSQPDTKKIFVALQMGAELGMPPMTSLKSIAVINGNPSLWGDGLIAKARATGLIANTDTWFELDGKRIKDHEIPPREKMQDSLTAYYLLRRKDTDEVITGSFSVAEAKQAKLWDDPKKYPWKQYPKRMLMARARGYAIKDGIPEALGGFMVAEEAQDLPLVVEEIPSRSDELAEEIEQVIVLQEDPTLNPDQAEKLEHDIKTILPNDSAKNTCEFVLKRQLKNLEEVKQSEVEKILAEAQKLKESR